MSGQQVFIPVRFASPAANQAVIAIYRPVFILALRNRLHRLGHGVRAGSSIYGRGKRSDGKAAIRRQRRILVPALT